MRTKHADRGKWAEAKVHDWLSAAANQTTFDGGRLPDAHAGSLTPALADFDALSKGKYYLIEVKEVQHARLLPHKNFGADKVARMRKRQLAGAHCFVIVHFAALAVVGAGWRKALAWRVAPLDFFLTKVCGSWDMTPFPLTTFDEAMGKIFQEIVPDSAG